MRPLIPRISVSVMVIWAGLAVVLSACASPVLAPVSAPIAEAPSNQPAPTPHETPHETLMDDEKTALPETGLAETGLPATGLPEVGLPEVGLAEEALALMTPPYVPPSVPSGGEALLSALSPPPLPELDPASLLGQSADTLAARLGVPDLRRREGAIEIWQYRMQACIIDFVLPRGDAIATWQSRHPIRGTVVDAQICRRNLARLAGL